MNFRWSLELKLWFQIFHRNSTMTELSLNCLHVGVTSAGKNVYPVCNTWEESASSADDITAENFEGADPCILTGYREMQPVDEGCGGEQVESLEEGCGEEEHIPIVENHELSFMYPAVRRFSVNLLAIFEGTIMVLSMETRITLEKFCDDMRDIFKFGGDDDFTMKWLDEEGDPCTISCQEELDEAIRLYELNRDSELVIHLFKGIPDEPGRLCDGETTVHVMMTVLLNVEWMAGKKFSEHPPGQTIHSSLPPIGAIGTKIPPAEEAPGPKRTRSDSPATRKRGLVSVDYSQGSKAKEASSGSSFLISMNDFTLLRVIGRGSYAKVLLVELKKNKRIYAMKVVKKELVNDDEDIDWVQTEKHVFEQASNHPFLVGLHSCFQTASRLFFVIEFVSGGDLMYHMQRQRRLPEDHARFYSAEISCALNFLHERGVIYRDLKLDNVLLDSDGHVKLTDYGMCKEGLRPGDTTSTFCGTPNYIAPEILRGEDYGYSVDWWALGVLMFEMLAGRSPFDVVGGAENPDQNTEDYLFQVILEKPIRIPRSLSVKAASILKGFLNKNPIERLGCHPQTGFADITSHVFFRTVDWEQLEARQVPPPFKPRIEDQYGLENFDPQFTNEPVQLTPDDPKMLETIDQSEFEGFEYINPLLMSSEECV
ncbi:protein kinase C iota type-like [Orbicella faveolata]|uniref:protein kinase C iota type-like n=1 Tax=Orbicella faveolata TaxID=48498 RepID=UPI0009E4A2EA|nr:protein kinase C iota type-like [Orbicella faveolata]